MDLIDRQAAMIAVTAGIISTATVFGRTEEGMTAAKEIIRAIKSIPSAQPEQRWIPCSERLPKPYEYCLWTTVEGNVVYHHCDGGFSKYTAWMPLPEPYKGEQDE